MRNLPLLLVVVAFFQVFNAEPVRDKRSITFGNTCPDFGEVQLMWKYENHKRVEPTGCILASGEAIPFGGTYKTSSYILRCDQKSKEKAMLTTVQCVLNGTIVDVGKQLSHNGFVYSCIQGSSCVGLKITGCVAGNGSTVPLGDTFIKEGYVFECVKEAASVLHKAIGCLIDGKKINVHKVAISGKFWYKCTRVGLTALKSEMLGCVTADGNLVDAYQTFRMGDFLYLCAMERSKITIKPIGCIAKEYGVEREFRFGEKWYMPSKGPLSYVLQCDGTNDTVIRRVSHCVVHDNGDKGRETTELGCGMRYGEDKIFVCKELENDRVRASLHDYDASKSTYENIKQHGVRVCP